MLEILGHLLNIRCLQSIPKWFNDNENVCEKGWNKYDKMLTTVGSRWRVYECLLYFFNFLNIYFNKKLGE